MQHRRVNPQAIAASEYKAKDPKIIAAEDAIKNATSLRAVVATPVRAPTDNIAHNKSSEHGPTDDNILFKSLPFGAYTHNTNASTDRYGAIHETNDHLRREILQLQRAYECVSEENRDLRTTNKDLSAVQANTYAKYIAATESANVRVAQLTQKNSVLQTQNDVLTSTITDLKAQLAECEDYDSILAQVINAHENEKSLEDELVTIREELDRTQAELKQVTQQSLDVAQEYAAKIDECEAVKSKLNDVRKELDRTAEDMIQVRQRELETVQKYVAKLDEVEIHNARLTIDLTKERALHSSLQTRYERLSAVLHKYDAFKRSE